MSETNPANMPTELQDAVQPIGPAKLPTDQTKTDAEPTTGTTVCSLPANGKDKILTVLIQTGSSKSGAQILFDKMNDEERCLICDSISERDGVYLINDSANYFKAFESCSDRLYKATTDEIV